MVRKFTVSALLVSCAALFVSASPASADVTVLRATLTGEAEAPGPGDEDASGRAWIFVIEDIGELCLVLRWDDVDGELSGLHIHEAPPGEPGPIVVPFDTPEGGRFTFQCVAVDEALLADIAANPESFYINLHSSPDFRPGAIRGQLELA